MLNALCVSLIHVTWSQTHVRIVQINTLRLSPEADLEWAQRSIAAIALEAAPTDFAAASKQLAKVLISPPIGWST